jgi:muramoyltetrapeptide carboxypeptidase
VEEIVMDKVKEYNYPVAFGCPAGHISDNRALVLGIEVRLKVQGNNVEIRYQEYS